MAEDTGLAIKGGFLLNEGGFLNVTDIDDGCDDCCEPGCPTDCTVCQDPITVTLGANTGDCACSGGIAIVMNKLISPAGCIWNGLNAGPFGVCSFGSAFADLRCDPVNGWTLQIDLISMGVLGGTFVTYIGFEPIAPCPPLKLWSVTSAAPANCTATIGATTA